MNNFTAKIPTIGGDAWRETLVNEKVQLAKEMGYIDRRLSEIEVELGNMGTAWKDSYQEREYVPPPHVPKFILEGEYTHEFLEAVAPESWYDEEKSMGHMALVMPEVEVWPVKETEKQALTFVLEADPSTRWKSPYAFELSSTKNYHMGSRDMSYKTLEHVVFVEYSMGHYVGFFVRRKDIQLVKLV